MRRALWLGIFVAACSADPLIREEAVIDAAIDAGLDAEPILDAAPDAQEDATFPDAAPIVDAEPEADATIDAGPIDTGVIVRTTPPPPRPYSGGTCPLLVAGVDEATSVNQGFLSSGIERSFRLLVPSTYTSTQSWPLVFGWHWLNASSGSFVRDGELESAIDEMQFIVVLPDKKLKPNGDKAYFFDWPFVEVSHAEEELVFFDDLLSCISQQYTVDPDRVYGIGVSAGALWVTHVMSSDRADYFAAMESLSGGLGEVAGAWQMSYTPQPNKFPALVLWGGMNDWLGVNFAQASTRLEDELIGDGHFVVECVHDQGHAMPPITPPPGSTTKFWSLWRFMLDHPYGMPSPYPTTGLPSGFPSWCQLP